MSFIRSFALRPIRNVAMASRVAVRTYAEAAAPSDKLRFSLVLPHETIYNSSEVTQVNLPAVSGEMGVLANHVPVIEQLKPGLVEVIESSGTSKQFFIAGGFATVQPNSTLSITTVEAFKPEDFSAESIKSQLVEANKNLTSGNETLAAEAAVEVEVLESLQNYVK